MKIAVLGIKTMPAFAGADRVVEKLLENLAKDNEYFVYLLKNGETVKSVNPNIKYIYIPGFGGKYLKPFSYFFLCTLHVLLTAQYDLAHIHNLDFGFFCFMLRFRKKLKLLGTFHGNPYERDKWNKFAKIYFKFSEYYFIKFCHNLTSVTKNKNSATKEIVYIPNGVETLKPQTISDSFEYEKFGLEKNNYFLFACGRLDRTKGLHYLVDTYLESEYEQKLFIVGDFSHDLKYSDKIENLTIKNKGIVLYKKLLPKSSLINLINNSRLFIFPSEVEAMSMMLLEVISCRKLVICSDIKENRDIVGNNYKYLFSFNIKNDLFKKINLALSDKENESLMNSLFDKCMAKFCWTKIADQYDKLYQNIVNVHFDKTIEKSIKPNWSNLL